MLYAFCVLLRCFTTPLTHSLAVHVKQKQRPRYTREAIARDYGHHTGEWGFFLARPCHSLLGVDGVERGDLNSLHNRSSLVARRPFCVASTCGYSRDALQWQRTTTIMEDVSKLLLLYSSSFTTDSRSVCAVFSLFTGKLVSILRFSIDLIIRHRRLSHRHRLHSLHIRPTSPICHTRLRHQSQRTNQLLPLPLLRLLPAHQPYSSSRRCLRKSDSSLRS